MPRAARKKSESGIYHIILRGINRQVIFENDEDSEKFLQTLIDYKGKSGYKIYAYCLMSNHIHLLLHECKEEIGTAMRRIGARYVYWYNWKYNRCGHLFQDRYKSETVEDESYLQTVLRYIHQNPLKVGLVSDIESYKWSSYNEYIGKPRIIDIDFMLEIYNKNREKAIESFKVFHDEINQDKCLDIQENRRLTDDKAIKIIKHICDIKNCFEIQSIEPQVRNAYLKNLMIILIPQLCWGELSKQ